MHSAVEKTLAMEKMDRRELTMPVEDVERVDHHDVSGVLCFYK
jgi:hypothetical protein